MMALRLAGHSTYASRNRIVVPQVSPAEARDLGANLLGNPNYCNKNNLNDTWFRILFDIQADLLTTQDLSENSSSLAVSPINCRLSSIHCTLIAYIKFHITFIPTGELIVFMMGATILIFELNRQADIKAAKVCVASLGNIMKKDQGIYYEIRNNEYFAQFVLRSTSERMSLMYLRKPYSQTSKI